MIGNEAKRSYNFIMDCGNYLPFSVVERGYFFVPPFFFLCVEDCFLLFEEARTGAPALALRWVDLVGFVNVEAFLFVEAPRVGLGPF